MLEYFGFMSFHLYAILEFSKFYSTKQIKFLHQISMFLNSHRTSQQLLGRVDKKKSM